MRPAVVIPAYQAAATLPPLLDALAGQVPEPPAEVVVVDDGSADDTVAVAEASPVVTRVLRQHRDGPGLARNRGAAATEGDALVFVDADCVPAPGWLAAGLRALGTADFVQGAVRPVEGVPVGPFDRTLYVLSAWGLYESANLFVRRGTFEALGGFESWLVPPDGKELGEDVWLGWRARRSGARMGFCADALVHHAVTPRTAADHVRERTRLRWFPAMAARIPELRDAFLFRRYFLTARSAAFDLAAAGVLAAAVARRPGPLAAAAPYARLVGRDAWRYGRCRAPLTAAAGLAADAVGAVALARGSVERRALVL